MRFINYLFGFLLLFALSFCSEPKSSESIENKSDSTAINNASLIKPAGKDSLIPLSLSQNELPANISFQGRDFHSAYKWYDKSGWNVLVLSTNSLSAKNKDVDEEEHSAELFVRQYNLKDPAKPTITWDMYDAELKCIFDITCAFITTDITDLDNNGIKETFVLYKLSCRSDVSPAIMKLIMHEEKKKYALRGKMIFVIPDIPDTLFPQTREIDMSKISKEEQEKVIYRDWGCFENANDFKNTPSAFLEHAKELWRQNAVEQNY